MDSWLPTVCAEGGTFSTRNSEGGVGGRLAIPMTALNPCLTLISNSEESADELCGPLNGRNAAPSLPTSPPDLNLLDRETGRTLS